MTGVQLAVAGSLSCASSLNQPFHTCRAALYSAHVLSHAVLCCAHNARREEEAVLRLTEDAGFKRRVMLETGTHTPTMIGEP